MKYTNCASVLALIAGTLAVATPAAASDLSINTEAVVASHEVVTAKDLVGDYIRDERSQQQQQQQQQQRVRNLAPISGAVYAPSNNGFEV